MSLVPEKKLLPNITRVVGVVSGKGGVGKSMTSVLLAQAFAARGLSVGIMDADITGPSIPRLLAIDSFRAEIEGEKLLPIVSEEGIKVLSINLFNEEEDQPVIWRGPLLGKVIDQFYADGQWGELDYLVIDFPPGTSDVALTAFQTIPFAGIVVVGTPQDYVSMIVKKSVRMAAMMKAPVLGLVENMRTMECPHCGEAISLFDDGSESGAAKLGLPLLASFPWRKDLAQARSLRWASLGEALKREAEAFATQVELAIAATPRQ